MTPIASPLHDLLDYLPCLWSYVELDSVNEICVNPDGRVFVEVSGALAETGDTVDLQSVEQAAVRIARRLGNDITEDHPVLFSRLADGSRITIVRKPACPDGILLSIRKFATKRWTLTELVDSGAIPDDLMLALVPIMDARKNLLISGGTSSGKTTVLAALCNYVFLPTERVVLIEDNSEIQLTLPHVIRLEAGRGGGTSMSELLRAALRLRPDRLIVGEVLGAEAVELFEAVNTGHDGTVCTIHASSPELALRRLASQVQAFRPGYPYQQILEGIGAGIDYVLHLQRTRGGVRAAHKLIAVSDGLETETVWERK